MKRIRNQFNKLSIRMKMYRLIAEMFIPIIAILMMMFAMIITRNIMYASVIGNIVDATGFNQDFKNEIDLQMYLFVSGSSDKLPQEDVTAAHARAQNLLENTTNADSRKAMNNVLTLCDNLSAYMTRIKQTEQYDERMEQLQTNIYVITQLIEDHIYEYLYHEASEIAHLQTRLDRWLTAEIVFVILITMVIVPLTLWRSLQLSKSITEPINEMNTRVKEIGEGDLSVHTPVHTDDSVLSALSTGIENMAERLNKQIELNRQEQIRLREIELSLIQAQINPHFLYNTLDAIVWLIEIGKNDQAEQMVTSLSSYFRSFLSDGKEIVTVAEEKTHIQSYLEIQQVRYRDIMEYEIQIDPMIEKYKLPKLTLQPLVENAIYHGLKPKRGTGLIKVTGMAEGNSVILEVRDTGAGMTPEQLDSIKKRLQDEDMTSFGLISAYKRLRLLYGEECSFDINSSPGTGTSIVICIPRKAEIDVKTIL